MMEKTKGVIFDLDNCIFDTRSLGSDFLIPVLEPIHRTSTVVTDVALVSKALWVKGLEDVITEFNIPSHVADNMRSAYLHLRIPSSARTYGDEEYIFELPGRKILVTTGYRDFQESKLEKLNISWLFDEIILDAYEDRPRRGKKLIFEEILMRCGWDPSEVMVVGDSASSELLAAKELGMRAIQTVRPGVEMWSQADDHVSSLPELSVLIR